MKKKDWTVKQHYVPQAYLRNFSPDGNGVYRFDLKRLEFSGNPVPIRSIAYEKNLYESKDSDGNFNMRNYIEEHFSQIEGIFAKESRRLLSAVRKNPYVKFIDLFGLREMSFWLFYISIQLLRTPGTMKAAEKAIQENIDSSISNEDVHTYVLSGSFPFFSDSSPDQDTIFNAFTRPLCDMNFFLGIDQSHSLWTSDHPVCGSAHNFHQSGYDVIFFPLSPDVVFFYSATKSAALLPAHACIFLTKENVNWLNSNIVFQAQESIFSQTPFSALDIIQIRTVWNNEQTRKFHK